MPVLYDGKKIIPAPLVDIKRTTLRTADQTPIDALYNITVTGKIFAYKGSPDSTGAFWTLSDYPPDETVNANARLAVLLKKQAALKALLATDGLWFEIQPWDGSAATKFKPRIIDISFPAEIWFDYFDYTITLEADGLFTNGTLEAIDIFDDYITSADESWTLEFNEQPENPTLTNTFRITHDINAVGKRIFNDENTLTMPAWQQAKNYVHKRLGLDYNIVASTGVMNVPSFYQGLNHVRSEKTDELNGSYGVTESWILASGNALEEVNIETTRSIANALVTVNINGTIQGLETRDVNYGLVQRKYDAALALFTQVDSLALSRAQAYAGVSLNPTIVNSHVGRNPTAGNITYGYEYNNRPTNCVANALSEIVTITDNNATDVFAAIPILGRAAGPILQNIGTVTAKQRQLSVELVLPTQGSCETYITLFNQKPDISSLIAAASGGLTFTQIFKDQDQEQWDPRLGTYHRTISWTYQ